MSGAARNTTPHQRVRNIAKLCGSHDCRETAIEDHQEDLWTQRVRQICRVHHEHATTRILEDQTRLAIVLQAMPHKVDN